MVSYYVYDVISSGWSSHFLGEMMKWCKGLIYVLFYVWSTKITVYCGFNLISNSWSNPRWRTRWRPLLLSSRQNRFEILQHIKISGEGFHQPPPPPPPTGATVGVRICIYVRGLSCFLKFAKIYQHSVGIQIFSPCHNKGSKLASVILRRWVLYKLINSLSKLLWRRIKLHFFFYIFSLVLGFSVLCRREWRSLETDVQPLLKWSSRFRLDDGRGRMHKSSRLLRAVNTRGQESGVQCLSNERHQLQRSWREFHCELRQTKLWLQNFADINHLSPITESAMFPACLVTRQVPSLPLLLA